MKYGAIIPAYNVEKKLAGVIDEIKHYLENIIVVNDGSSDSTKTVANNCDVIVLSHKNNSGKGAALITGFHKAISLNWDAIITLDADGQHDPNSIPDFINFFENNTDDVDFIIGSRMKDISSMPLHRIFSNKTTSQLISWRIKQKITDSQSGYRLLKSDIVKNINLTTNHYDTETEILLKSGLSGYKISMLDINTIYNDASSSMHLLLDTLRFIKLYWQSLFW